MASGQDWARSPIARRLCDESPGVAGRLTDQDRRVQEAPRQQIDGHAMPHTSSAVTGSTVAAKITTAAEEAELPIPTWSSLTRDRAAKPHKRPRRPIEAFPPPSPTPRGRRRPHSRWVTQSSFFHLTQAIRLQHRARQEGRHRLRQAHRIHELTGDERILGAYLGGEELRRRDALRRPA